MRRRTLATAAVFACTIVLVAVAAVSNRQPLQGTLEIRGAAIVDPPPEEARDTHAAFLIKGEAARLLYDTMKVAAVKDECLADGSLRKQIGSLKCLRLASDQGYECDFAVNIKEQTIEPGRVC